MPAKEAPFTITAGDYRKLEFEIRKPVLPTQRLGDLVDLASCTGRWVLATGPRGSILAEKTAVIVGAPANGKMSVELLKADTLDLGGSYYHELEVTDASGHNVTVSYGTVTILPSAVS